MTKRYLYSILMVLACGLTLQAQETGVKFGHPTSEELGVLSYPDDPTADAVILYERAYVKLELIDNYLMTVWEVHKKIKVINAAEFDPQIRIGLHNPKNKGERISKIEAVTHNGIRKDYVAENEYYTSDYSETTEALSFAFANVKDQSVVEYSYRKTSPYLLTNLYWDFQHELPTLYSELVTEIPGNYTHNTSLRGKKPLDKHDSYIKKSCLSITGMGNADCYYNKYIMKNIPAFKEEEYMLSKYNYLSQISYELKEHTDFYGKKSDVTKTWDDVDEGFRYDYDIGRETKHVSYFENILPPHLKTIQDPLERAKAVYYYVQSKINWNGKQRVLSDMDCKKAFENGSGNSSEVNLVLYNALRAVGLEPYLALSSTRNESLPTQLYPVFYDFSYATVYININNTDYFLDITSDAYPFGLIPFYALNYNARIMDFKNGSYWQPIAPYSNNTKYVNAQIKLSSDGLLTGNVSEMNSGYYGTNLRINYKDVNYSKWSSYTNTDISDYEVEDLSDLEKPVKETFTIERDAEYINGEYHIRVN